MNTDPRFASLLEIGQTNPDTWDMAGECVSAEALAVALAAADPTVNLLNDLDPVWTLAVEAADRLNASYVIWTRDDHDGN